MPDPDHHPEGDRAPAEPPITPPPRSDAGGLSTAMRRADQQAEPIDAVERALNAATKRQTYSAHSTAFRATIAAQEVALKQHVAEIDDAIEKLQAERDDIMLTYSMISGAITAQEKAESA